MKKMLMSIIILLCLCVLASCGASPTAPQAGVPTHTPTAITTTSTATPQPTSPAVQPTPPPDTQPTVPSTPPLVHLHVGTGVQLAHFYVTVTRAELKSVQTPPPGMTYLLVTATLRNTTTIDRPLLATNYVLHDANGKAYVAHVYSGAPAPPFGVIKPGTTILGPLVFQVPMSQQHFTFTYQWTGGLAQASWDVVA